MSIVGIFRTDEFNAYQTENARKMVEGAFSLGNYQKQAVFTWEQIGNTCTTLQNQLYVNYLQRKDSKLRLFPVVASLQSFVSYGLQL